MKNKYLECGKIINTHGIKGQVKLESFCDSPQVLAGLKKVYFLERDFYKEVKVIGASVFKNFVIMSFDGINDCESAELLKGSIIYADRDDIALDEGSFFIADLIGLDVIDNISGRIYGKITDVINRGASDIYVVSTPAGEKMIPAVGEFIKKTDLNSGVYVKTIPGLLDD